MEIALPLRIPYPVKRLLISSLLKGSVLIKVKVNGQNGLDQNMVLNGLIRKKLIQFKLFKLILVMKKE